MDDNPVAPTPAETSAEASVATPISTNSEPVAETTTTAASAPEIGAEQVAKYLGTDVETLEKFTTFTKNNGQFDGAFKRMKDAISRPQATVQPTSSPEAPQQAPEAQPAQTPVQAPEAPQSAPEAVREGSFSLEELAAQQYFDRLAGEEKYVNIADEIRSGEVLKGLKEFNITAVDKGRINDKDVRKYLDLYAATKPAKPTSTEPTTSPSMVDDTLNIKEITTREEADRIQYEDVRRRMNGQPGHPMAEKAKEYLKKYYSEHK